MSIPLIIMYSLGFFQGFNAVKFDDLFYTITFFVCWRFFINYLKGKKTKKLIANGYVRDTGN